MSKRQKISFYDLSRQERMVLTAVSEAMRKDGRSISVDIGKKRCYVNVHPWEPQAESVWKKITVSGVYECQNCGQNVMTGDIEAYKYCHGCGARMKVEPQGDLYDRRDTAAAGCPIGGDRETEVNGDEGQRAD